MTLGRERSGLRSASSRAHRRKRGDLVAWPLLRASGCPFLRGPTASIKPSTADGPEDRPDAGPSSYWSVSGVTDAKTPAGAGVPSCRAETQTRREAAFRNPDNARL